MNIIVAGCGRVGSRLAEFLSRNDHDVSVIDNNQSAFRSLGRDFNGRTVRGLAFDEDVLRMAGIETCDVLAAVTDNDSTNLMVVEVARKLYGVNQVIARLTDHRRSNAYAQLGIDHVCGTDLISEEIFAKIESGHGSHIDAFGEFEIMSFSMRTPDGLPIASSMLEDDKTVRIVAVQHEGTTSIPLKETLIHDGDIVLAAVRQDALDGFSKYARDFTANSSEQNVESVM